MQNKSQLRQQYEQIKAEGLNLDMSRGKPGADVLDFSNAMLTIPGSDYMSDSFDCRNYIPLDGIPEVKKLLSPILGVTPERLIIGGNSSLQMMYDTIVREMLCGVWKEDRGEKIKFICLVPGYDRHFAICERLSIGMEMVALGKDGPDMDLIERLVADDDSIKGIWCVPMYSNPTGITYSDEVVRRFARMKTKSANFRILWDNAYAIHHLNDTPDSLLNILDECESAGNPDRVYMFASTSKVTFPGGGVAMMATSDKNADFVRAHMGVQTIGGDKLNQLRHVRFFGDFNRIVEHMKRLSGVLKPKFDTVTEILERELGSDFGVWHKPNGGYFISFDGNPGTAKETVRLCREAGVILTNAGATFPYNNDPDDKNIRIAPSFPPVEELKRAMEVFCVSVKLANEIVRQ
ncbi:MAG: aminotransferase [Oscillospiraceae bacterium]|nr:aminotransferase [Oscillospiraceae bacterium]